MNKNDLGKKNYISPGKCSKSAKSSLKLPIIWLAIVIEFISKVPSKIIGHLKTL
jgi:hypothetical protein